MNIQHALERLHQLQHAFLLVYSSDKKDCPAGPSLISTTKHIHVDAIENDLALGIQRKGLRTKRSPQVVTAQNHRIYLGGEHVERTRGPVPYMVVVEMQDQDTFESQVSQHLHPLRTVVDMNRVKPPQPPE